MGWGPKITCGEGHKMSKGANRDFDSRVLPSSRWGRNSWGSKPGYSYGASSLMGNQQAFGKLQLCDSSLSKDISSYSRFYDITDWGETCLPYLRSSPAPHFVFSSIESEGTGGNCSAYQPEGRVKKKVCYLLVGKYVWSNILSLRKLLVIWDGYNQDEFPAL